MKSDAASRAGTGQKSTVRRDSPRDGAAGSGSGTGRRVVVVKKGSTSGNTGSQPRRDDNRRSQSYNRDSGDDGMSYNPFAAFFNNKK